MVELSSERFDSFVTTEVTCIDFNRLTIGALFVTHLFFDVTAKELQKKRVDHSFKGRRCGNDLFDRVFLISERACGKLNVLGFDQRRLDNRASGIFGGKTCEPKSVLKNTGDF